MTSSRRLHVLEGGWAIPAYLLGLCLVFLGERVLGSTDAMRWGVAGTGMVLIAVISLGRLTLLSKSQPERAGIEKRLALFSVLGLLAVGLYYSLNTESGRSIWGLATATPEVRDRIEGAGMAAWLMLLLIAIPPLVLGDRALAPMRDAEQLEAHRVSAATSAGLTLGLSAAYLSLFVFVAGTFDKKIDFSYFRTARPGESTVNIAKSLNEPVKVQAFFPQLNDVGIEVDGYLKELAASAPQLQVEVLDRLMVPGVAKEAKVVSDGVVLLRRGDASRETLTIGADMKTAQAKLKTLDGDFQKVLLKVIRPQRTAYLTVGHGEINESGGDKAEDRKATLLKKLLESQNYVVKDLGLAQGLGSEIPADATVVLVLGPTAALLPEEIASLKRYLDRAGKLFLALDPEPNIDWTALAGLVGLDYKRETLANDKTFMRRRFNDSDRSNVVTNRFSSHASVSTLSKFSQRAPVIFPGAGHLTQTAGFEPKADFTVRSMPDTFGDANQNFTYDGDTEKKTTFQIAAAVAKPSGGKPAGADGAASPEDSRAFVVADSDAFTDTAIPNEPNALLVLDAVRWLGGEESFSGAIESTEDVRIEHTKEKDVVWFYGTIFGAPALVLAAGLIYTKRSRSRRAS